MRHSRQIRAAFLGAILAICASASVNADSCGEASCVPVQGTYVSHFSGPACTGSESYYLPYDGYAYSCRTWDGGGQCGTISRTVSNRSYRSNGVCHEDAWPSGNTLDQFVTVYRTTSDPCQEGTCVPAQSAYISHFTGAGCTGTESYYLPYDGYTYQCRPWNGRGRCGTVPRTVTNRSYLHNGTCYDAWPSGNPLNDFVTVYRPADDDGDGLPDSLELALAQYFFPILNLHCGTFEGLTYADRRQLYGHTVSGYTNSSNGRIPFVAYPYNPGNGKCAEPFQCIEIRYGIAWNWDLGDDIFPGFDHRGDSETYAILVARRDTDGWDWGTSWEVAQGDPGHWRLVKEFMSAHWGATGDSSSFRAHGNYGTSAYQTVWAAEGKHAMYPTQSACNSGASGGADDCSDNRCNIVDEVFLKVRNAGQLTAPLFHYIPYPGSSKTTPPSGTYDIWGGTPFGDSTAYKTHLTHPLSWCPVQCY